MIAGSLTKKAIIYSFGIGTNASFEEQALRDFGCQVYAFDPTPKSIAYVPSRDFGSDFHLYEIGISDGRSLTFKVSICRRSSRARTM